MDTRGAIFVLPTTVAGQQGPVASWMSTAGWASGARRVLGAAWIVGPEGTLDVGALRRRGSNPALSGSSGRRLTRSLPSPVKTAVKDVRQWRRARAFRLSPQGPWSGAQVAFVWQRHDLFHDAGLRLARDIGAPSVLFVPATLVWEAAQWGVRRPGWGSGLERLAESPALRAADVVACGSADVVAQVRRLGVRPERVIVTPTGVDLDLFDRTVDRDAIRARMGISGRFVVGWVGSFRRFHALDTAIDAAMAVGECVLLLVGDGPERAGVERYARQRGVDTVFTGTVPHDELPSYLAAMDVGLVLAQPNAAFHYSPLKLAEYLASGLPVVVPDVPHLTCRLTHGVDALVAPRDDAAALAAALRSLRDDPDARVRIGAAARAAAVESWSWDHAIRSVVAAVPGSAR